MTEEARNTNARRSTPTDKMLVWAEKVADRTGDELPDEAREDFEVCRQWLDDHPNIPPSEKQIAYAQRIAEESDIELPDDALTDYKVMSKWLDENAS